MADVQQWINFSHQRGLALITAMLVVAIAATAAAYLSLDQQIWLRQAQNRSDREQAEVVRAGAEEWAITILDKDANNSSIDDLTENWSKPLPPLAVEGGQIMGSIADTQARFNLNNLVRPNIINPRYRHVPRPAPVCRWTRISPMRLSIGSMPTVTSAYGAEDIDYLQLRIPYRAANQTMQSVDELRLVRGFTPEIVDKLRPLITVLPKVTEINVNTAKKEVLSALFYTLTASDIEQLMSKVPYKDQASLTQKLQELAAGKQLPQAYYNVKSNYFEVTVDTLFGRYRRTTQSLIVRPGGKGGTLVLWHSQRLPTNTTVPTTTSHRYFHRKLHPTSGERYNDARCLWAEKQMPKQRTSIANRVRPFGKMLQRLRPAGLRQGNTLELLLPRGWPESHGNILWRLRGGAGVAPHGQVAELNQIPGVAPSHGCTPGHRPRKRC
jgi:general secretion pathway protein K